MKIPYRVHGVVSHPVAAIVTYGEEEVSAMVPGVEVELVPVSGPHSTLTLRFTGSAAIEAKDKFVADTEVNLEVGE